MNLFGKKKEEEFEEEENFEDEERLEKLENRKLRRKLKDLNPENKKKRKEPLKPWGKKERWIVGGFFLVTTVAATGMFLFSHDFKLPGLPRISIAIPNFSNLFGEEVIKIGQKSNVNSDDSKSKRAVEMFNSRITPLSGHYGFLVTRLSTNISYGVSMDEKFQGASLLKLPLITLMYKMNEAGTLNLDTRYTLKNSDKVKGSGILYSQKPGTAYTYRKLAEYMGKDSDRTAYNVMKSVIGDDGLKNYLAEIGMVNTNAVSGDTTPGDIGLLLQKLWKSELVNQTDRDEILGYLTNTIYEKWITAGVPKNVAVAHKFGQDQGVMADGGIIKTQDPYVLVVMGQGITTHDADVLFPKVSGDIYKIENDVQ
jgi:beta-lactamase class A